MPDINYLFPFLTAFVLVLEQQAVIAQLHRKISELEARSSSQQQELKGLEAAVAAGAVALKMLDTRTERSLQDQISKIDQKCARRTADLQTKVHSDLAAVAKSVKDLQKK